MITRAITVRLPFAAAIAAGTKLVENRGRPIPTRYIGSRVAIHAAATWSPEGGRDSRIRRWWWGPDRNPGAVLDPADFSFYFRHIVAVATVVNCHEANLTGMLCCPLWGERWYDEERGQLAWHIVLDNIVRPDRLVGPVRGSLSVPWTLPDDVATQVRAQVGVAS